MLTDDISHLIVRHVQTSGPRFPIWYIGTVYIFTVSDIVDPNTFISVGTL